MNPDLASNKTAWPEAIATVTACKYNAGAGRAVAFGIPTTKHFRISYNYFAPNDQGVDELHTGEFASEKPVPQGTLFPIRYNPEAPHHNSHDPSSAPQNPRAATLTIGIIGSIILSLAWFAILRGCH
ncbi:MAG: DUF3592 domain-containing protein [Acidobacteriaceae bacterium]